MATDDLFGAGDFPAQEADWDGAACDDEVTRAAQEAFGIRYLFAWQRAVIANILDSIRAPEDGGMPEASPEADDGSCRGRQIVLLPTGAGKSLCFLVPALLVPGPTLVIYPLLALMADQKRRMDAGSLASVTFRGGQTEAEREENFRRIKDGARLIIANPEVLQDSRLVRRLAGCAISHIAIDEAHCVSEWGDTFRPAYLTLGAIIRELGVRTVTAFTATASPQVLSRVSEVLFGGDAHIVRSGSDRPNIRYTVVNAYAKKRAAFRLALTERRPLLIFCGTRRASEDMARELAAGCGADTVRFYHAGLTREEKTETEQWFYGRTDAILCCTCAYGMGVDKKDIRTVIHLEPPATVEAYVQESGRAARDGSEGTAILLWSRADAVKWRRFADGSREEAIGRFATATTCRRQVLLDALGGEQAACSGCDVCARGGAAPFAEDAASVLAFVLRHRKFYTKDDIVRRMVAALNARDCGLCGVNPWDASDVAAILSQLEEQGLVRTCAWPWKGRLDRARGGATPRLPRFLPGRGQVRARLRLPSLSLARGGACGT